MDDAGARGGVGQAHAPGDIDRMETLEQQVRQLASRLAGWVEGQLVQAVDDRRNDMKALRAELRAILDEQLAGMRAEATSVVSVATRRLEVGQEQLTERLDTVAERVADAAATARALSGEPSADSERLDALEQRVRSAMSRLSDSVEARLAEAATTRSSDLGGLRAELTKQIDELQRSGNTVHEQVDAVAQRTSAVADDIRALRVEVKGGTARNDELEKRVKAAIGRLADSVESRLAEFAAQSTEESITKLAEGVEQRRAELEAFKTELEERLAVGLTETVARIEIFREQMTAALDAHLAETRDEVTLALGKGRLELAASAAQLESLQATLRESDLRLRQLIQAKQGDFEAIAGGVAKARTEMDTTVASVNRELVRTEDQVQRRMATLSEKVAALTKRAAVEAGSLAPLRSDLRLLQGQVAELAEVVADLRPKRRAPARKATAPAKNVAAAPAKDVGAKKPSRRKAQ